MQSSIQALNTNSCDAEKRIEGRIVEQFHDRFERLERIHYENKAK